MYHIFRQSLTIIGMVIIAIHVPLSFITFLIPPDFVKTVYTFSSLFFIPELVYLFRKVKTKEAGNLFQTETSSRTRTKISLTTTVLAIIPFGILLGHHEYDAIRLFNLYSVALIFISITRKSVKHTEKLRLGLFAFWLGLFTHWLACGWLLLNPSLGIDKEIDGYLLSLYWVMQTLATVGYGDIPPQNNAQVLFAMLVIMFGVATYGYILGNIAQIISKLDPAKNYYMNNMERLKAFISQRNLPDELQSRIRGYYEYIYEKKWGMDEMEFVQTLPQGLKQEVSLYLKRSMVSKIPLFDKLPDFLVKELALGLESVIYTPGEYIFCEGEQANEMYFVIKGKLEVLANNGQNILAELADGDYFGEVALVKNSPRNASIRAASYCDLYKLEKMVFETVLSKHPQILEQIKIIAEQRS